MTHDIVMEQSGDLGNHLDQGYLGAGAGAPFSEALGLGAFRGAFFYNIYIFIYFYILMHVCQQKHVE